MKRDIGEYDESVRHDGVVPLTILNKVSSVPAAENLRPRFYQVKRWIE